MVAAYLLNGATIGNQVNSVGGAQPLIVAGTGMTPDSGSGSMAFTGLGSLQLPSAIGALLGFPDGIAAATLLIGYASLQTSIPLWQMGGDFLSKGDWFPYSDGNFYTAALCGSGGVRNSFPEPSANFTLFNQIGVTGAAGGNILFYFNGSLINTNATQASTPAVGSVCKIGNNADGGYLRGNIQFFYAWTRVLSSVELAALAADPYGPIFPGVGPVGAEVSKANLYASLSPPAGTSISKANVYAVVGNPLAPISTVVPSSGGAVSRCQVSHVLPSRLLARDWSAFQRQIEVLRPADVEEVRGSRFDFC